MCTLDTFALPWECPVPQIAKTVNQIVLRYFTFGSVIRKIERREKAGKMLSAIQEPIKIDADKMQIDERDATKLTHLMELLLFNLGGAGEPVESL